MSARPMLKRGCRLNPSDSSESLLLIPEGAIRLRGPGRQILELCDGRRTLADIIAELQSRFASAEPKRISSEVVSFLQGLAQKGAVEFPVELRSN